MADKSINDLNFAPGTIDDANTLFVVSQSGTAYKVSGHEYITALGTILDGHGGIKSIAYTAPVAPSLDGTLTITLADDDVETLTITNGKGFASSSPVVDYWARSTSNSTVPTTWYTTMQTLTSTYKYLWHYQHYAFNDGTSFDTTKSVIGVYGDQGDNSYVWIRYSGVEPTSDADMGTTPDDWMGIYSGTEGDPSNLHYTDYAWFQIKGDKGDQGDSISAVSKTGGTGAPGTIDVYTVYVDGTSVGTFNVYNGSDGEGSPGTQTPLMDGTAAVGTATAYSREDHRHPTDTSRASSVDVGNVSNLSGFVATNLVDAANELKSALTDEIITVTSAIAIPASGSSITKNVTGITANHQLTRWNFSSSEENNPPVNLSWSTANGSFTISNTGGTTSESITPMFALPTSKTAS